MFAEVLEKMAKFKRNRGYLSQIDALNSQNVACRFPVIRGSSTTTKDMKIIPESHSSLYPLDVIPKE